MAELIAKVVDDAKDCYCYEFLTKNTIVDMLCKMGNQFLCLLRTGDLNIELLPYVPIEFSFSNSCVNKYIIFKEKEHGIFDYDISDYLYPPYSKRNLGYNLSISISS